MKTKEQFITIYKCMPNNKQQFEVIENSLEGFNKELNGYFKCMTLYQFVGRDIVLIYNEDATMKENPQQTLWIDHTWIYGTCFLAKLTKNSFSSLTEDDKEAILEWMKG